MKIGVTLRNMGPQSTPDIMAEGAAHAEALAFDSLWITDHIAIPPDDAEGSGGRYTDPLTTLAWLAGKTQTIGLATGVMILPYRPALPTAKQVATLQEFSGERLILGVGVGWMDAEFKALGLNRHRRGRQTDEVLALIADCFSNPIVEAHGQPFIFDPRPEPPPVYIGGRAPHALDRAIRFGHGWLPMARDPSTLARDIALFDQKAKDVGTTRGPVTAMTGLPLHDKVAASERLAEFAALPLDRLVCALRYQTIDEYRRQLDQLGRIADEHIGHTP